MPDRRTPEEQIEHDIDTQNRDAVGQIPRCLISTFHIFVPPKKA